MLENLFPFSGFMLQKRLRDQSGGRQDILCDGKAQEGYFFCLEEKQALGIKTEARVIINVDSKLYVDNNYLNLQIRTLREKVCSSHSLLTADLIT